MSRPLRIAFDVACSSAHAFEMWTTRIDTWWPSDHTVCGERGRSVILEARVGGRIYEVSPAGLEHEWGVVTTFDPPTTLAYSWHIGRPSAEATDVVVRFVALDRATTRIEIEHRGWERLGDACDQWRERNESGWKTLLPHYVTAIEREPADGEWHER